MTQDRVSDELWNAFMLAWEAAPDSEVVLQARFALNAVAPRLRAEGMREAAAIQTGSPYQMSWDEKIAAILARADALDPPPQKEEKIDRPLWPHQCE